MDLNHNYHISKKDSLDRFVHTSHKHHESKVNHHVPNLCLFDHESD